MRIANSVRRISPRTWFFFRALRFKFYNGQPDIWLMRHCMTKGSLAIDIGASIGLYSRELAKCAKHVVAFEANPRAAEFAKLVVPSNVDVESVALSSADGDMTLRIPLNQRHNTVDDLGTIEPKNTLQAHRIASQTVKAKKLDDYGFTDCGFIKIDVEGHEEAVLDGGMRLIESSRPILMIELDDSLHPGIVGRVRGRLAAFGYAAFEFQDGRLQAIGQDKGSDHRNLLFIPGTTTVPALSRWDRFGHAIRAKIGY